MNITIEKATPNAIDEIHGIENASFSSPWSKNSFLAAFEADSIHVYTARDADLGKIIGFIVYASVSDEAELMDIATSPESRGCGAARMLMEHMIKHLDSLGVCSIFLEVRISNLPARSLYEKFGFSVIGVRKNYYTKPTEDALLMSRAL